jgi:hypothetical protein
MAYLGLVRVLTQNRVVGALVAVAVGALALVGRQQTNHPQVHGKDLCLTLGPAAAGTRTVHANVELSDRGGPRASGFKFTFNLPDGRTATAIARRLDSPSQVLSGGQGARYELTAIEGNSSKPTPRGITVKYGSPNVLSIGGGATIALPRGAQACNSSELQ